jgi:hypothetical protein
METVTIDRCDKIDRCLCYLKKQLGNSNNVRILCLQKKGLLQANVIFCTHLLIILAITCITVSLWCVSTYRICTVFDTYTRNV